MDFDLTDEQRVLADTVRTVLEGRYPAGHRELVTEEDPGWSRAAWKELAGLGVVGLTLPEAYGGMGAGAVDLMVVLTEVGRRLAPEPVVDAALLPGELVARAGSPEQRELLLPQVGAGDLLLAWAHREPGARWPDGPTTVSAEGREGRWHLTGRKNPVLRGDCADLVVVSAGLPGGGIGLFLVDPAADGVTRTSYRTHDGLRAAQLDLDRAAAVGLGEPVDRSEVVCAAELRAQAALCAEAVGAMGECLRLTTDYLKTRRQFGVPLARFQTLTQRAADMYVALELARSMSLYVAMCLDEDAATQDRLSRAKLVISRSARLIGQESIQMHGGIGLTAEYPLAHYVSRLTAIEHTLGSGEDHLRFLSRHVADHESVWVS